MAIGHQEARFGGWRSFGESLQTWDSPLSYHIESEIGYLMNSKSASWYSIWLSRGIFEDEKVYLEIFLNFPDGRLQYLTQLDPGCIEKYDVDRRC